MTIGCFNQVLPPNRRTCRCAYRDRSTSPGLANRATSPFPDLRQSPGNAQPGSASKPPSSGRPGWAARRAELRCQTARHSITRGATASRIADTELAVDRRLRPACDLETGALLGGHDVGHEHRRGSTAHRVAPPPTPAFGSRACWRVGGDPSKNPSNKFPDTGRYRATVDGQIGGQSPGRQHNSTRAGRLDVDS